MNISTVGRKLRGWMAPFLEGISAPEPRSSVIARLSAAGLHMTEADASHHPGRFVAYAPCEASTPIRPAPGTN